MPRIPPPPARFPDPRRSSPEGIVAFGDDLRPETLMTAYRQGIFPWTIEGYPLPWFCPPRRGILDFRRLHVPRSLARVRRNTTLRLTIDRAFDKVIEACSQIERNGQPGTWITSQMIDAYGELHRLGHAHSVEAWDGEKLVGGLYGVDSGGAFAGESMFHFIPNASKLALLHLTDHLSPRGATWIDIQTLTPHMVHLGAHEITRDEFLARLARDQRAGLRLF